MADNRGKVESPLKMFPTLLGKEIKERGTQMLKGTTPSKQLQENGREHRQGGLIGSLASVNDQQSCRPLICISTELF